MTKSTERTDPAAGEMQHHETTSDEASLPRAEFDFFLIEDASEATLREAAEAHQGEGIPLTKEELKYLQISRPSLFEKPIPEQLEDLGLDEAVYNEVLRADMGMRLFEVGRKLDFDVLRKGNNTIEQINELHAELDQIQQRMVAEGMLETVAAPPDSIASPFEYATWCKQQVLETAVRIAHAPERTEPMLQLENHPSAERLQKIFGDRMEVAVLFGSAVFKKDSQDYDCLVIVDNLDPEYLEEVSRRSLQDREENDIKMSYLLVDRESASAIFEADPISVMYRKEGAQVFGKEKDVYELPVYQDEILKSTVKEGQNIIEMRQNLMATFSAEGVDRNSSREYRMRKTPWRVATTMLQISKGKIVSVAEVGKVLYEAELSGYEQKPREEFGDDYADLKNGVVRYNSQMGVIAALGMEAIEAKVQRGEHLFAEMEATSIESYDFDALSEEIARGLISDISESMYEDPREGIDYFEQLAEKFPRVILCKTGEEVAGVVAFSQPINTENFGIVQSVKIAYSKTANEEKVLMEMGGAIRRELTDNGTDSIIESNPSAIYVRERLGFKPIESIEQIRTLASELGVEAKNLAEGDGREPVYEDIHGETKSLYIYRHHIR